MEVDLGLRVLCLSRRPAHSGDFEAAVLQRVRSCLLKDYTDVAVAYALVAQREAEVARREAELLAGAPGGVLPPAPPPPPPCPVCPVVEKPTEAPPVQTIIKEVFKETEALTPPGWWDQARIRAEDIPDRELKIAEREREISRREEAVNRREHDATRRENWIIEQLK